MSLVVTVSGSTVSLLEGTAPKIQDTLDQRSKASFKVFDATGTVHFQYGQAVSITDSVAGLLFTGYVNDATEVNYPPNAANEIMVNCFDQHYLADKRVSQVDYEDEFAGDIVADLASRYLSQEGVTASYAVKHDSTVTDFAGGTLSNTVAASNVDDGDLELASSGTAFTQTESTTANFATGTLTNTTASNNLLTLASTSAIKLSGTSEAAGLGTSSSTTDNYCYMEVWNSTIAGSAPSIASGDTLQFSIFLPSTNPACVGGVDLVLDNGTALYQIQPTIVDQQGLASHPGIDLSGYAKDQWYARTFHLDQSGSSQVGRSIKSVRVALKGDTPGNYIVYVQKILLVATGGSTKTTFFNGTLQTASFSMLSGYANVGISVVSTYATTGNRVSPAYSIAAAGIARNSFLAWTEELVASATNTTTPLAVGATGANNTPYVLIESSLDGGATWQTCSNHSAMPGVTPGMNLAGMSLTLRETLSLASSNPTVTPALISLNATIAPSYQQNKIDVAVTTDTQAQWNTGTITTSGGNPTLAAQPNGDLTLNGKFSNWVNADTTSQTVFGTGTAGIVTGAYSLNNTSTNEVHTRLDWASTWGAHDFVIEADVFVDQYGSYGILYMTTNWVTNNNTWGYLVDISLISGNYTLTFSRGSNSGSTGTQTVITQVTVPVSVPEWHRVRIAYTQSSTTHNIYVDDVLYITSVNSAITGAGNVGVRFQNSGVSVNSSTSHTAYFQNFGVVAATTGTWTSTGTSLTNVGTAGGSLIEWSASVPVNASLLMYSSLDNGSTWQSCTNGAALPTPTPGTALSGKTLKVRATLTSNNANATVALHGVSVWIFGQYSASGSRVGLPLNLSSVGRAGSTLVNWDGIVPANTTLSVDTSLDNNTWTNVGSGAAGSAPIAGITSQIDPIEDTFDTNTGGFYTSTYQTNGTQSIWTWDTTNSRLTSSGGTTAQLLYNSLTVADIDLVTDMDLSDAGGLVWRQTDSNNFYDLTVGDASSPTPGLATLCRIAGNTRTTLATAALSWTRGTPHRIRATMFGGAITVYFDGTQIITYTDNHPFGAGRCGLRTDTVSGASAARFYLFHAQAQGDSVVGKFVYTRVRFTSTDPTVTPQLTDITTSVRSAAISNGAFIPSTTYSVLNGSTNSLAQCLDDLAKQSNNWWRIDKNKSLFFQPHHGTLAPFVITNTDMLYPFGVSVKRSGDLYRNIPYVLGGTDTIVFPQSFVTDGVNQTYTLEYPVDSLVSVAAPSTTYTFGVKGVDSGRDFYYQQGNNTINQDASEVPLPAGLTLTFQYNAQINVVATTSNAAQIATQATLEGGTSGMVEVAETAQGLNRAAASQLAASRLTMYGTPALTIQFTTARVGLSVGQQMSVFLPQHQLVEVQFLITDVAVSWRMDTYRGTIDVTPYFTVTGVAGPILNSWATTLAQLGR